MPRARLDLSVEAARERLTARCTPLVPQTLPLAETLGRVLATDVHAPIDLPSFTNSAMDGYAVHASDLAGASVKHPVRLPIVGSVEAGDPALTPVLAGQAVRIGTGAELPAGCDAVVPTELANETSDTAIFTSSVELGRHVRQRGEDIRTGQLAVAAGRRLRPQEIGLLAGLGIDHLPVIPVPSVAILSIGPELFRSPEAGGVYDANGPMLAALAARAGARIIRTERTSGARAELTSVLHELAGQADLIVTSGGISNSSADTMAALLGELDDAELWQVRLRPGKHFGVAAIGTCVVLSLPGNPIAALAGFMLLAQPAISALSGDPNPCQPVMARLAEPLQGSLGRTDAVRGFSWADAMGQQWVKLTANRGSGALSTLAEANCLVLVPEHAATATTGDTVEIVPVGYQ